MEREERNFFQSDSAPILLYCLVMQISTAILRRRDKTDPSVALRICYAVLFPNTHAYKHASVRYAGNIECTVCTWGVTRRTNERSVENNESLIGETLA